MYLNSDVNGLRKKTFTDSGWEERSNEYFKLKGEIKRNCIKLNNREGHIEWHIPFFQVTKKEMDGARNMREEREMRVQSFS